MIEQNRKKEPSVWISDRGFALRHRDNTVSTVVFVDPGRDLPLGISTVTKDTLDGFINDLSALNRETLSSNHQTLAQETITKLNALKQPK